MTHHAESPTLPGAWIWHPAHRQTDNCYVYFRRTFLLRGIDDVRRASLCASANSTYRLYVNGVEIGTGPSPSLASLAYYDTYTVTRHLCKGRNCIAALVFAHGPSPQGVLRQRGGPGRFYFSLTLSRSAGKDRNICSDAGTRCLAAPQYKRKTPPISWHLGEYKEEVDLRKAPVGWTKPGFGDSQWRRACEISVAADDPDVRLIPREIPFMRARRLFPCNAYAVGFGKTYDCSRDPWWEIIGAEQLVPGASSAVPTAATGMAPGPAGCLVRPLPTGGDPTLVIDFGRLANGQLHVELEAPAGACVRIGYGESLNVTYVDRFTTRRGANHIRPFGRRHARYLFLTFSNTTKPIEVRRVYFDHITYPAKRAGTFLSSDPLLDRIYEVSADTVQTCMHDHFEDGPWREQMLCVGDLHVEALVAAAVFGDTQLARKCLRNIAWTQRADGAVAPFSPRWDQDILLIDFVAHYVLALRNHVLYSGDLSLGEELFPTVRRALDFFLRRRNARGLIEPEKGSGAGLFIDWQEGEKPLVNPALHAFVVGAADAGADIARWLGHEAEARRCRDDACELRAAAHRAFFDAGKGVYRDAAKGCRPNTLSTRTNAVMALYDVAPRNVVKGIRGFIRDRGLCGLPRTPYFNFFVGHALGKMGAAGDMVEMIRGYWGEMVKRGAASCWEFFDPTSPRGKTPDKMWSRCHGWSAGPGYLLPTYVLGVRPAGPAWRHVIFRPCLAGLASAEGTIPTPHGVIEVALKRGRKPRIRLPKGVHLKRAGATGRS